VSVLRGEGTTLILYGMIDIPVGARTWTGYLSRPDGFGEWPTVVVVPGAWGLSGSVKDFCRRLARHGIAAIAADPYRGLSPDWDASRERALSAFGEISDERALGDIDAFGDFIANPSADWSNAESGFGVLGLGDGGVWASRFSARHPGVVALALLDPPLPAVAAPLGMVSVPILGTVARSAGAETGDDVGAVRSAAEHAEWALYGTVETDYWDADRYAYDAAAAIDTFDRIVGFFGRTLPPKE
jgi:dienelactone hydrolase